MKHVDVDKNIGIDVKDDQYEVIDKILKDIALDVAQEEQCDGAQNSDARLRLRLTLNERHLKDVINARLKLAAILERLPLITDSNEWLLPMSCISCMSDREDFGYVYENTRVFHSI